MNKKLLLAPLILLSASMLTGCDSNAYPEVTLRILNSEDYIYLNDPKDPDSLPDIVDQFIDYIRNDEDILLQHPEYKNAKIVYDTSDTNESIYSELMTGKSHYDLINVSDYMAQKIISGGYAVPILNNGQYGDDPWTEIPNYEAYASKEIKGRLDNIVATQKVYDSTLKKWVDKDVQLKDYAVGYMWGTLGILFNPYYNTGITPTLPDDGGILVDVENPEYGEKLSKVISDMQTFSTFWNTDYNKTISIKNSMRDTYAVGVLETYKNDFADIREDYLNTGDLATYQTKFAEYFNRSSEKNVNEVGNKLNELKSNIFGLEVDSGKQDIITQKIGINMAWSGDAVYSMDQAEDRTQVGDDMFNLCYAVPELGSNIWMDVWVMPNVNRTAQQSDLAKRFLDFLCNPVNAAQNMDYTGYTSFMAGDSILELVRDWYDIRTDEIYYYDDEENCYSIYRTPDGTGAEDDFALIDFPDCVSTTRDVMSNDWELYYFKPYYNETEEEYIDEPRTRQELLDNGEPIYLDEEMTQIKTYGDIWIVDTDDEVETVDLTYFFKGTLSEDYSADDMFFYSDCYLPFENEDSTQNISVGRQFFCQYPDQEVLARTAVMKDYGENNKYVMKMWENFRSNPLPTGSIVIFVVIIAALAGLGIIVIINKGLKTRLRNKRKIKQN